MVDFVAARRGMIDSQVSASSVTDPRLLTVMGRLPRELFVPETRRSLAYSDQNHDLGGGRFMPSPAVFARLVQLLAPQASDTVLDVGAGLGYGAAVLAHLSSHATALESDANLADKAQANLAALNLENVAIVSGPLANAPEGSFDAILLQGSLDKVPDDFLARLRPGGRLVVVMRRGMVGSAVRFVAEGGGFTKETHFDATLPLLYAGAAPEQFIF
jgi:protein-L-isoaspartate(D-aspartate) O-methyltransferase